MRHPWIPSAYAGRSITQESARLVNLYAELSSTPGSASVAMLIGTPGLRLFSAGISSPVRGAIQGPDGICYAVQSNVLLSISATGQASPALGHLTTSTGCVSMAENGLLSAGIGGNQIAIADGENIYIYNVTTAVFTTVNQPITHIEFIDSYFIGIDGTMNTFASDIYDGLTWNPLATTPVEAASDRISNLLNLHQQLFYIKEYTTEVFYNNGQATAVGFPYSRMGGAVIDYGTKAPWSVCRGANSAFFMAWERKTGFVGVVMLNGYTPVVISPPAVTWAMSQSTDLTQCFGYCYSDEGHTFCVMTNPVDRWTWVYDTTTQMWHERSSSGTGGRHISNCYVRAYDKHLVGDYLSGRLYEMGSRYYTDAGQPITSLQRTQHLADDERSDIFIGQLQVDIESGVGMDGPATPCKAYAVLTDGGVSGVTITDAGADYISITDQFAAVTYNDGTPIQFNDGSIMTGLVPSVTVLFVGDGTGAVATATLSYGSVVSIEVTAPGSGYTYPPEVVVLGQPVAPVIALSISKDGGRTYGNEYPRSMGKQGEYRKRVTWSPVGRARDMVFQFRVSSPCKRVILGYSVKPV